MKTPGFTAEASLYAMRDYLEILEFERTSENVVEPELKKWCNFFTQMCKLGSHDSCAAAVCCLGAGACWDY